MQPFRTKLRPVPHGGQYVVVPEATALAAGLRHGHRVRGTVNGTPYRSSLMKYSGVFHLGVHKATLAVAAVAPGASVAVTIELDDEPLPTDTTPSDLAAALAKNRHAAATWSVLRPSAKREHVKGVLSAKKAETRARRIATTVAELAATRPPALRKPTANTPASELAATRPPALREPTANTPASELAATRPPRHRQRPPNIRRATKG